MRLFADISIKPRDVPMASAIQDEGTLLYWMAFATNEAILPIPTALRLACRRRNSVSKYYDAALGLVWPFKIKSSSRVRTAERPASSAN
jgi:hypothetical protein